MSDTKPRLAAPPGTTDTHLHVYGPRDRYPLAPTCPFDPPPGGIDAYRRVMARLGIERAVVVQPTAYGFDNRCTLDAAAALGERARAVVVIDPDADDAAFEALARAGARGIRFHMFPGGVLPWERLERGAARAHELGWHVQLQLDGRGLPEREAMLRRLPCDLVVDHVGKFLEPVTVDDPAFRVLLGLLESGRVWVKLSAAYETSRTGPPDYADVGALARALLAAAPQRMLWASNWPHPSAQDDPPDDADQLDVLGRWIDDEALRRRVLVDNPAALYGFDAG